MGGWEGKGQTDGWMDGWMEGQMEGGKDEEMRVQGWWTNGQMKVLRTGWGDGWTG